MFQRNCPQMCVSKMPSWGKETVDGKTYMSQLFTPLTLPNGTVIPNRIAKAAMEENMADADHAPGEKLFRLYRTWADGGAGLILTGNVMIDRYALTGPGGVVLESEAHLEQFQKWAAAARGSANQVWMQINHPGRQVMLAMGQEAVAPSAVPVRIPGLEKIFPVPRALSELEIRGIIERFVTTAKLAERAGFNGVQVHAAHGYLLSQFLSPLSNQREDQWGGSLKNRARLLLKIVQSIRERVSPEFCVGVKLNSADFQRGGFDSEDAVKVVQMLNPLRVDLVEVSGGSYESPAMRGLNVDGRTLAREAHFLEFATRIQSVATMPVLLTGGISRFAVAERALKSGIDMVGMATALAMVPDIPDQWSRGQAVDVQPVILSWRNKALAASAASAVIKRQLELLSLGKSTQPNVNPVYSLIKSQVRTKFMTRHYRKWVGSQQEDKAR